MLKKIASFLLFSLLLFWIGLYVKGHLSGFQDIRSLSLKYFFILPFFYFMYFLLQGFILKTVVEPFGIRLKFNEWFGIIMITLMGNCLVPFGGFGFRATYLKRIHAFDYTHFISTLGAIYLIEFLIFTLGGFIGLGLLYFNSGIFDLPITILTSVVFSISATVLIFSPHLPRLKNAILQRINAVLESWRTIKMNYKLIKRLLWLTLLEFLLVSYIFYFAFHSFNFGISFVNTFLTVCLSDYSLFIRLLPASFGLYEGAIVYSSRLFNLTVAQGLLVAVANRAASLFLIFTLGPLYCFILIKKKSTDK